MTQYILFILLLLRTWFASSGQQQCHFQHNVSPVVLSSQRVIVSEKKPGILLSPHADRHVVDISVTVFLSAGFFW